MHIKHWLGLNLSRIKIKALNATIVWTLFIAFLCGIPGRDIPHISFLELLSFDKWVHAGIFFILFIFLFKTLYNYSNNLMKALSLSLISCILYGILLEIMQGLVFIERSADIFDVIANSTGAIIASWMIFRNKLKRFLNFIE